MFDLRLEYMKLLGGVGLRARLYIDGVLVANIRSTQEGYDWEFMDARNGKSAAFGKFLTWVRFTYTDLDPCKDYDVAIDRMVEESQEQFRQRTQAA